MLCVTWFIIKRWITCIFMYIDMTMYDSGFNDINRNLVSIAQVSLLHFAYVENIFG